MVQDVRIQKTLKGFLAPEDVVEIFRETLPTGLNDTENLILDIENAILEA